MRTKRQIKKRRRACKQKIRLTATGAKARARLLSRLHGRPFRADACSNCSAWHVREINLDFIKMRSGSTISFSLEGRGVSDTDELRSVLKSVTGRVQQEGATRPEEGT